MTDHNPPLGIWEGIIPEPDLPTDGDTQPNAIEDYGSLDEFALFPQEDEPDPNAWIDDCGYDVGKGFCELDGSEECILCPYRQAIGDVQP